MKRTFALVSLATVALAWLVPGIAMACSYVEPPTGPNPYPIESVKNFPTNGLFTSSSQWLIPSGKKLELVEDKQLSKRLGITIKRPKSGQLTPNAKFAFQDCKNCPSYLQTGGKADKIAPAKAVMSKVKVLKESTPLSSCLGYHRLELTIEGKDDTTPQKFMTALLYISPSAEASQKTTKVGLLRGFREPAMPKTIKVNLQISIGNKKKEAAYQKTGNYCFSVALMDWAGNIGKRSKSHCIPFSAPQQQMNQQTQKTQGIGCQTFSQQSTPTPYLFPLFFFLVLAGRKKLFSR